MEGPENVEASGIWYCRNPLCPAAGTEWFKRQMASYQEINGSSYSIDDNELIAFGEWLTQGPADAWWMAAVERALERLKERAQQ